MPSGMPGEEGNGDKQMGGRYDPRGVQEFSVPPRQPGDSVARVSLCAEWGGALSGAGVLR